MIPVQDCEADLLSKAEKVTEFNSRIYTAFDPDNFVSYVRKKSRKPLTGLVYEGLYSQTTEDLGKSSYIGFAFIVVGDSKIRDTKQAADKAAITGLCDSLRTKILHTNAPSGHLWEFVNEMPMDIPVVGLVYYQQWRTVVIL
ncbi:MAG: hypothetical protein GWN00_01405 [Aliifodinibius sp.]|nr:hypothetical protein [Phycisphaerae bacterium]NIR62337.1 hypothetical protein [candidate division Zixibacteria bacterium]NIT54935.1 hypothetical protein [Fodinibius sp.]NIW43349.1 hypothetical protein [Gammaproteobacteria bacterium]NIU12570.1 hypothetical protein [candidate division Zixibacteria bacterium]